MGAIALNEYVQHGACTDTYASFVLEGVATTTMRNLGQQSQIMLCVQVPMHVGLDYRRHVCLDSFLEPPRSCSCSGCSQFHLFGIASEKQACLLFLFEIK